MAAAQPPPFLTSHALRRWLEYHGGLDDSGLVDLRYLVSAEVFDDADDSPERPYHIGCLLEVGHTPQRVRLSYAAPAHRDEAFARLIALHQALIADAHEDDPTFDA